VHGVHQLCKLHFRLLKKYSKQHEYDFTCSTDVVPRDIPRQQNGCDCGVFALKYADYLSEDAPMKFSQADMPYFRNRICMEIVEGKLRPTRAARPPPRVPGRNEEHEEHEEQIVRLRQAWPVPCAHAHNHAGDDKKMDMHVRRSVSASMSVGQSGVDTWPWPIGSWQHIHNEILVELEYNLSPALLYKIAEIAQSRKMAQQPRLQRKPSNDFYTLVCYLPLTRLLGMGL
jgi:hypothetical protein